MLGAGSPCVTGVQSKIQINTSVWSGVKHSFSPGAFSLRAKQVWLGDVGGTETSPRKPNAVLNQVPMSGSVVTESIVNTANPAPGLASNPTHAGSSDLRMLAQVEKWMAVIR
jgi:hypothetical protein